MSARMRYSNIFEQDTFPNVSYFYVACVCNDCHWKNQSHCFEYGSDDSSFRCLRRFLFFVLFFFFALESDDDVYNESDDGGYGSGFTSGLYIYSYFELSVDRVSWFLSSRVSIFIGSVRWIFSGLKVSWSKMFEHLILADRLFESWQQCLRV